MKSSCYTNLKPLLRTLSAHKLSIDFNVSIYHGTFPNNLKYADVSPAYKKGDRLNKCNYRSVSILSSLSQMLERLLFYQINDNMDPKLSIYQSGFRKIAQNCTLLMLEKLRKCALSIKDPQVFF